MSRIFLLHSPLPVGTKVASAVGSHTSEPDVYLAQKFIHQTRCTAQPGRRGCGAVTAKGLALCVRKSTWDFQINATSGSQQGQYKISLKRAGNHDGNRSRQFCSRELVSVPEPWNSYLLMWFGCWLTKWRLMRYRCDNLLVLPCWSRLTKKHSLTTTSDWFINGRYDHWPFTLFLIIRVTFLSCGIFFSWKQCHCL